MSPKVDIFFNILFMFINLTKYQVKSEAVRTGFASICSVLPHVKYKQFYHLNRYFILNFVSIRVLVSNLITIVR